jgi:hypothetical protein
MAKREFTLPGIHELSKVQEDARAIPKMGQHLIIGGPGTGKSVLALLRRGVTATKAITTFSLFITASSIRQAAIFSVLS